MSFYLGMQHIEIDRILLLERARKDLGDIDQLCQSIEKLGLLQAICVNRVGLEYHLVDGQRRIMAYKQLGHNTIPAMIYDFDGTSLEGEYDANMVHKNFTPSEAVALAEKIKTAIENRAKLRQYNASQTGADSAQVPEADKKTGFEKETELKDERGKLPRKEYPQTELLSELQQKKRDSDYERTRDTVAKSVGMSYKTLEKAKAVVESAEENPENVDLVQKMDETGKVEPQFRELQERKKESGDDPAVHISKEKKQKVVPVVYMPDVNPDQKMFSLSHLTSERFRSGSALVWIAEHLEFTDGCDILIQRRGDVVHVYQHHDLMSPPDVRLCSSDIGDIQNKSFLNAVKKLMSGRSLRI